MNYTEIFLIAIGLSMDAFAVSLANGIIIKKIRLSDCLKFGLFFGIFQFIMPAIGWGLGTTVSGYISAFDHWIAFLLLGFIGVKMIYESLKSDDDGEEKSLGFVNMTILAIATSIDALAVGISFAVMETRIFISSIIIGITTFIISFSGVILGKRLGVKLKTGAEVFGGIILISIGLKILIEHLFF